jgi:hypothetical protein
VQIAKHHRWRNQKGKDGRVAEIAVLSDEDEEEVAN